MELRRAFFLLLAASGLLLCEVEALNRSFTIDYENDRFLMDGLPFSYISGAMHYFRVPREHWQDRFLKMRAAGLNTVETYVEWSQHEPEPGVYNFEGNLDLVTYITMAQQEGLYVLLRPGPYICAEREMGGLPYWLLREKPDMVLRSKDETYLSYVDNWMTYLFSLIKPLLYANGGPILTVQVENEYGSYFTCDFDYTTHLRKLFQDQLGQSVVLFTTDGAGDGFLKCGKIQNVYATIDFGAGTDFYAGFKAQRNHDPSGPLVNSEFYTGWLDHWGEQHVDSNVDVISDSLHDLLANNISVNMYMFHGGTNFGFMNGANLGDRYQPQPTSYDYDSPLNEAGDPTEMYFRLREVISEFVNLTSVEVPPPTPKYSYGQVQMGLVGYLFDILPLLTTSPIISSQKPLKFEELGQAYGFVLYETVILDKQMDPAELKMNDVRDRAYVFVDYEYVSVLSRMNNIISVPITVAQGQMLSILVENQGRVNYGSGINDFKGLISDVTLDGVVLTEWKMTCLPFNNTKHLEKTVRFLRNKSNAKQVANKLRTNLSPRQKANIPNNRGAPAIYSGEFTLPSNLTEPQDTFLYLDDWYKGIAVVNGFNLGRYWPILGPQMSLFVPKGVLLLPPQANTVILFELETAPCSTTPETECVIDFRDHAIVNSTTPMFAARNNGLPTPEWLLRM